MAKVKGSKKLYGQLRAGGIRKKVAKELASLPEIASHGERTPKSVREAVGRLDDIVAELHKHARQGNRKAAGRKAARTRGAKAERRSRAAKRAARTRA
jgi:hypothetical protein